MEPRFPTVSYSEKFCDLEMLQLATPYWERGPTFKRILLSQEAYLEHLRDDLVPALTVLYPNPDDLNIANDTF
ncbi:hypothetical protein NQ318_017055 [Aromia moschata]|uniref:Uncharacterized protein n=1 Tax=Aromia moschata TaxID=1265417 RepID=A0AAV8Y9V9_9CUCU|nr:hypothetical protein NQ318_017055 [Aromia moschata]